MWMLQRWRHSRNRVHGKGIRTQGARKALDQWSVENVNMLINQEMRNLAPTMTAPIGELTEEKLLAVNLEHLETAISTKAPTLWSVLHHASTTPQQLAKVSYKTHSAVSSFESALRTYLTLKLILHVAHHHDGRDVFVRTLTAPLPPAAA